MGYRFPIQLVICAALIFGVAGAAWAQGNTSSDLSNVQRLDVMRSKLESMHRSLSSAIASTGAPNDKEKRNLDDPRERLRGLRCVEDTKRAEDTKGHQPQRHGDTEATFSLCLCGSVAILTL